MRHAHVGLFRLYFLSWTAIVAHCIKDDETVNCRSSDAILQGALLQKTALVEQSVMIDASGEAGADPVHPGGGTPHEHPEVASPVSPEKSPEPQALLTATPHEKGVKSKVSSAARTPPPGPASANSTEEWVFTPVFKEATPPPLLWGRPDKIRKWRISHGMPSTAKLPPRTSEGDSTHLSGWDPCLFASTEHPSCVKKGVVPENVINHEHYERRRDMVLLLIVVVVLLSIGFDKCHESLIEMFSEKGERHLVRMVEALMKELTVLGFISLMGSMFIRSGNIGKWSLQWFGHPPDEVAPVHHEHKTRGHESLHDVRAGHCISELTVLFEDIHLLIFCIMISLISVAASNMLFLNVLTNNWSDAENVVKASKGKIILAIAHLVEAHKEASTSTQGRIFLRSRNYERQIIYLIHKSEFLHPAGAHPHHNVSIESFSFYEYLKYCCGEAVTAHMEIPSWIYCICLVFLVMLRPLFGQQGSDAVALQCGASAILALTFLVIYRKLLWIERQLVPKAEKIHNKTEYSSLHMDHDALVDLKPVNKLEVITYKNFVWIRMLLFGTCSPSPHEQLFWFHRKGPDFINNSLRLLSFILAIFLGEWLNHMISFPYTWSNHVWSIPLILVMCGAALVLYQNCTIKSVTITSTELTPRHDVINHINQKRLQERQKYHKDLLDNIKIQAVQRNVFVTVSSGHEDWIRRYNKLPRGVQRRIHKTWKAFDQDGSGSIERMELEQCLRSLGKYVEEGSDAWLRALNAGDVDAGLSEHQFRVMMVSMHEAQHAALRKDDAIAVLAGLTRHHEKVLSGQHTCVWEEEGQPSQTDEVAAEEDGETLYDVEQVSKLLFNHKMLSEHHHPVVGIPENYAATDFLQCVLERTQFYGNSKRAERKGLSATVSQIVAYLGQVDLEAHPDHHTSAQQAEGEDIQWAEGEMVPDSVIKGVRD